jgi:hypothetical protein
MWTITSRVVHHLDNPFLQQWHNATEVYHLHQSMVILSNQLKQGKINIDAPNSAMVQNTGDIIPTNQLYSTAVTLKSCQVL